jgi:ribonucleoside-diphosphate reductase alpha chain
MLDMAEGPGTAAIPACSTTRRSTSWHTCKNSGPINASNPCSRVHVPRRHGLQPVEHQPDEVPPEDGTFDVERFRRGCRHLLHRPGNPGRSRQLSHPAIAENSHLFRPLGLGYANLGSLLMSMGIPYDSDAGRGICGALTALLHGAGQPDQRRARRASARSPATRRTASRCST